MRAVVVSAFGGPEVLTEAELPDPEPGPGQITIDTSHLVVRDIGGRIGFERAITHPERVLSLTVLNSPVDVAVFRRPWPMHPFAIHGVGEAWLVSLRHRPSGGSSVLSASPTTPPFRTSRSTPMWR